ncbi:peptidoglycan-binding domain-containing protein [Bartonella taylorii]|uniref:peptidoglycan-binding domain-containing protein n=1 Tax=Bartonella taylorii TaxID=33046 RepID=UPI001ABB6579|nr:peptidoglycan-binding domain-containing protein [Bartonella taylorii]
MIKKRKTRRTKTIKQRKHYSSIIITLILISGHFLFWIAKTFYFYTRKNAFFFIGALLFTISFGFVAFNALFSQMKMQQNVFTKMKFTFTPHIEQNSTLSKKEAKFRAVSRVASVPFSNPLRKNSSSPALSENTLKMQQKLAKLGLYDGPLDGVEGPKMRRAIALWKQQAVHRMQNNALPNSTTDEIAVLIKQNEMEIENETTKTSDMPRSKEAVLEPPVTDIIQVQKALRIFGNKEVLVTGKEDQKTIEALKQFQKMFDLPITGKIDHIILMKMREVGLLN